MYLNESDFIVEDSLSQDVVVVSTHPTKCITKN